MLGCLMLRWIIYRAGSTFVTFTHWQGSSMVQQHSQEKEAIAEGRSFEATQERSKERRNGIVGAPPILTPDGKQVKIDEEKNDRRRRNGIVEAPFVGPDGFVTSSKHQHAEDSRSR